MLKIAICDDDKSDIRNINKAVCIALKKINIPFGVDIYSDAFLLLKKNQTEPYDLIFLDIDMPEINGMDVASKLNSQSNISEIIFVTNHDELVYRAYRFKALGFIRKKYLNAEIDEIIELFIKQTNQHRAYLLIHDSGAEKKISINDIIYMQSNEHYVNIFTSDGKKIARKSLNEFETEYGIYGFIRVHMRYLVNYRYIYSIEKRTVVLNDKRQLPLSRSKISIVKDKFLFFSKGL